MSAAKRCADWREKYPDRAKVLQSRVMRLMGIKPDTTSPFAIQSALEQENLILCAVYGVDPDPLPAEEPLKVEAKKVLDLEDVPLTGRDRAIKESA